MTLWSRGRWAAIKPRFKVVASWIVLIAHTLICIGLWTVPSLFARPLHLSTASVYLLAIFDTGLLASGWLETARRRVAHQPVLQVAIGAGRGILALTFLLVAVAMTAFSAEYAVWFQIRELYLKFLLYGIAVAFLMELIDTAFVLARGDRRYWLAQFTGKLVLPLYSDTAPDVAYPGEDERGLRAFGHWFPDRGDGLAFLARVDTGETTEADEAILDEWHAKMDAERALPGSDCN